MRADRRDAVHAAGGAGVAVDGYVPIDDYAIIGDCRTAALVSCYGSIDWLCLPHFSAPSVFAALLDRRRGGRFVLRPRNVADIRREYLDHSAVLCTTFRCARGVLRLTDAMTMYTEEEGRRELQPQHELLRIAECLEGEVTLDARFEIRPDYGRRVPRLQRRGRLGWLCAEQAMVAYLYGDLAFAPVDADPSTLAGSTVLRAGERCRVVFSYTQHDPATLAPVNEVSQRLRSTCRWWQDWASRCSYNGLHRDVCMRSCLTLKLLSYRLSGAVVAAATTSLPEGVGSERNWDYRYCWLRDASMLLQSFIDLGFRDEAEAFFGWLMHATRLTQPLLQVLYDVYGETALGEGELPLEGHGGHGPVRVGNSACEQVQLDIYGQVLLTALRFVEHGGTLDAADKRLVVGFGESVRRLWREPDHGIWEIRLPPRHNTHSKLMCWVALDCVLALHRRIGLGIDESIFTGERERIREDIEANGYDPELGSYVGYYGGKAPDAALLLMARYGYIAPDHPRMLGTVRHIERELSRDGLLYRYPPGGEYDGVAGPENLFVICSFWLVDYLARLGECERARALFERLVALTNDLGLYAEQLDAASFAAMGNFPQAFSHEGLITAALALEQAARGRRGEGIRK